MQSIPSEGDPLISVFGLENASYYLWLSPLLGSIFAVTLTAMFVAGVLKGTLFPEFIKSDGGSQGLPFFHFTWNTLPRTSEDYGKLFVWAFLAGFAERLVPDSLDTLAAKLDPSRQRTPTPDAGPTGVPNPASPRRESQALPEPKSKITDQTLEDVLHAGEQKQEPSANKEGNE